MNKKKKTYMFLWTVSMIIGSMSIKAQTTEPCAPKNISTHPAHAQNIAPALDGSPIRLFDWLVDDYDWTKGNPPYQAIMHNPYRDLSDDDLEFLLEGVKSLRDNLPEDGWELMAYNDGRTYSTGNPLNRSDRYAPYLILYNRFRSVLRVFVFFDDERVNIDYDVASVSLMFPKFPSKYKQSANFTVFNNQYEALDNFPKKLHTQTLNHLTIADYQWIWADFPMSYDPCVCEFEYDRLRFSVTLIDSATVWLDGTQSTYDPNASVQNGKKITNDISKGIAGGTDLGKSLQQAFKVHKADEKLLNDLLDMNSLELKGSTEKYDILLDKSGNLNTLGTLLKDLPQIGFVFSLIDGLSASSKPLSPTQVSFKSNINLKGGIKHSQNNAIPFKLRVPGSKRWISGAADELEPLYDEPMGVMVLMETPKLEYVDYYADANAVKSQNNHFGPYNIGHSWKFDRNNWIPFIRQYHSKIIPKLAINPSAGLELIDIRFTYRINYQPEMLVASKQNPSQQQLTYDVYSRNFTNDLNPFNESIWKYSQPVGYKIVKKIEVRPYPVLDFKYHIPVDTSASSFDPRMEYSGYGFEQWNSNPVGVSYTHYGERDSTFRSVAGNGILNTYYLPYSYMRDQTFFTYTGYRLKQSRNSYNNYSTYEYGAYDSTEMPKIELKIQGIFVKRNNPESDTTVIIQTYPVRLEAADVDQGSCSVTVGHLGGASQFHLVSPNGWQQPMWPDPLRLPFDLRLENTSIGPGDIQALNNIYIGDNVTIASGTNFYAGNSIEITGSDVVIPPTSVLEVRPPSGVTPMQPQDYLLYDASPYCVDRSKYNPEVANKRLPSYTKPNNPSVSIGDLTLHPNPAHDHVYISGIDPEQVDRILCLDALGRMIHQWEGYVEPLDVSMLQPGMYLIQVRYKDGRTSESLKLGKAN